MEPLRLFFYREGEHYDYQADVRVALGEPIPLPLDPARAEEQGFIIEPDPYVADYLLPPFRLDPIIAHRRPPYVRDFLEKLPYFPELERRHALFTCHDLCQPLCTCASLITDDPARSNREDPSIDSFPHAPFPHVLAAAPDFDFDRIRFDVSFVGTVSDPVRMTLLESVGGRGDLRHYLSAPLAPYWERSSSYLHMKSAAKRAPLERLYVGVMRRSWAVLCPRGRGSSSIRFFETMCMGRLPVLVSDEYTPPLSWRIDYDAFCLRLPEAEAGHAGELLCDWLAGKSREEREEMCRLARRVWEENLAPEREAALTLEILRRRLPSSRAEASGPVRLVRSMPGALLDGGPRRSFPPGYFAGMVLDDGRNWFSGGMLARGGPRPDTVVVDGLLGGFPREGLGALPRRALAAGQRPGGGPGLRRRRLGHRPGGGAAFAARPGRPGVLSGGLGRGGPDRLRRGGATGRRGVFAAGAAARRRCRAVPAGIVGSDSSEPGDTAPGHGWLGRRRMVGKAAARRNDASVGVLRRARGRCCLGGFRPVARRRTQARGRRVAPAPAGLIPSGVLAPALSRGSCGSATCRWR